MQLKLFVKNFLRYIRWQRIEKRFKDIDSIIGFHHNGKIIGPEYISIGRNTSISSGFVIQCFPTTERKPELVIGDNFWARDNMTIFCAGRVEIGNNVTLAKDVFISDENHGMSPLTENYRLNPLDVREVIIGNGCWLGEKVCVLPGVHIGEKCIIGAGAVVTKDIPDYCVAVGNPAKVIKTWSNDKKDWVRVKENNVH